jgi:hypothetical protein
MDTYQRGVLGSVHHARSRVEQDSSGINRTAIDQMTNPREPDWPIAYVGANP